MDLCAPLRSLNSDTHGRVLTVLAAAERPLAGQAVARRAGMSPNAARRALDDFVASGIVWRSRRGANWSVHLLDPEHLLVPALRDLADVGPRLQARLAAHVADWSPPPATVAFRAPAPSRVDGQGRDMVELLVAVDDPALLVQPTWVEQVDGLVQAVRRWTGNEVHLTHATVAGLDKRVGGGRADSHGQAHTDGVAWLLAAGRAVALATAPGSSDPSE